MTVGYVQAKYSTLVELFGPHQDGDPYKVQAEWRDLKVVVDTDPVKIATVEIYDYKSDLPKEEVTTWHVQATPSSRLDQAVNALQQIINEHVAEAEPAQEPTVGLKLGPKFPHVTVKLIGTDSNIFSLGGKVSSALKEAGESRGAEEFMNRIFNCGSYNEALSVIQDTVTVR